MPRGPGQGGSSFPLSSDSAQSWPSGVRGTGAPVKSRATRPPGGSGLAVALIDVVLHQSHHLLKLVLQLGPPGRGVRLQGRHDLRGSRGAMGLQAWASVDPLAGLWGAPCMHFHSCWPALKHQWPGM